MATKTEEKPAAGQTIDEGWEQTHGGASQPWQGEQVGDFVEGTYIGSRRIDLKDGQTSLRGETWFELFELEQADGSVVSVGATYMVKECFATVNKGDYVRLTVLPAVDLKDGRQSMRNYKIARRPN